MNSWLFIFFFTILSISFAIEDAIFFDKDTDLYEGSECYINNKTGICKLITNCPRTYLQLIQGKKPLLHCNFNKNLPVICCVQDETDGLPFFLSNISTATPVINNRTEFEITTLINEPFTGSPNLTENDIRTSVDGDNNKTIGPISSAKCKEYRKTFCQRFQDITNEMPTVSMQTDTTPRDVNWNSVVGKKSFLPEKFRSAVVIGYTDVMEIKWYCGGTLISERFVLTTAHCTLKGPARWVRVGDWNLIENNDESHVVNYKIIDFKLHPDYKPTSLYHDIGLLKLEQDVTFNEYVRPVCLDFLNRVESNTALTIGWEKRKDVKDKSSNNLLLAEVSLIPNENCSQLYKDNDKLDKGVVKEWQICTAYTGKNTCQGYSGIGLFISSDTCMEEIIGITNCDQLIGTNTSRIYSRISHYIGWIESIVWPNLTAEKI